MAAQEGIGGTPHEAIGSRAQGSTAASAGSAFLALLALLQNGAAGDVAATPDGTAAVDVEDGQDPDADASDAGATAASEGVVVTLSVASAVAANANANAAGAVAAATGAAQSAASAGGGALAGVLDGERPAAPASAADGVATLAARLAEAGAGRGQPAAGASGEVATKAAAGQAAAGTTADGATHGTDVKDVKATPVHTLRAAGGQGAAGQAAAEVAPTAARQDAANARDAVAVAGDPATASSAHAALIESPDAAQQGVGSAAEHGAARRATVAARPEPRIADDDAAESADATEADGAFGAPRSGTASVATRELPPGVRLMSDALQPHGGPSHGAHQGADVAAHPDALGAARSDATAASGAGGNTTRLRAAGFSNGAASLPSWVERLASPDGLGATRRGDALHLDLEPNGLGRIEIRLSFGKDGVRASVLTEHEHTRALLASQQPQLAAALERNDMSLESFLVDVGTQSGGDGREAWRDATDPAAFDQIGLVHVTSSETVSDQAAAPTRGLVSVRA